MNQKMNPEAKAKIVDALRSGNYKQGKTYLRTSDDCFCVWGVISDVSGASAWAWDKDKDAHYDFGYCVPAKSVQDWVGMDWSDAAVTIDGIAVTLSVHNDRGASFEKIADAIEQQL